MLYAGSLVGFVETRSAPLGLFVSHTIGLDVLKHIGGPSQLLDLFADSLPRRLLGQQYLSLLQPRLFGVSGVLFVDDSLPVS